MKRILILGLISFSIFACAADESVLYPCDVNNADLIHNLTNSKLIVCYFGSKPMGVKHSWTFVTGVSFKVVTNNTQNKILHVFQSDEVGLDVGYKITEDKLILKHFVEKYPGFEAEPFLLEEIDLSSDKFLRKYNVLLKTTLYTKKDIERSISFLKITRSKYKKLYQPTEGPRLIYLELFKLRNYAVIEPKFILKVLQKFEDSWWVSGEVAEVYGDIYKTVLKLNAIKQ